MRRIPGETPPTFDTSRCWRYPNNALDEMCGRQDAAVIFGSIWEQLFRDDTYLQSFIAGRARLAQQLVQDLREWLDAKSRKTVPLHHVDQWYALTFRESEINTTRGSLARYDGTYSYGEDTGLSYGIAPGSVRYEVPMPAGLVDCRLIMNRQIDPSRTLVRGVDFELDRSRGLISFRENPFHESVAATEILEGGAVVDRETTLWLFRARFERRYTYRNFGYVVTRQAESSVPYRQLVNALFDSLLDGTSAADLNLALAAIAGVPVVAEEQETVQRIFTDRRHLVITTDAHAYLFPIGSTPLVAVGDTVRFAQPLTDAFQVFEFTRGQVPSPEDLPALAVGRNHLTLALAGNLVFVNQDVALTVQVDDGLPRLEFELGGYPGDVEAFWDAVHAAGKASGKLLAELLPQRNVINPLQFLAANVLRNNYFVVRLRPSSFGPEALNASFLGSLQKVIPPHTGLLLYTALDVGVDAITLQEAGITEDPSYDEELAWYTAIVPPQELLDPDLIEERVRFYSIAGRCL